MSTKMTVSVYDDVHHQVARGLAYDLWRVRSPTERVKINEGTITDDRVNLLFETDREEDLGSFELVLHIKDYFQGFPDYTEMELGKLVLPFGTSRLGVDDHLGVHITPTSFTCTL